MQHSRIGISLSAVASGVVAMLGCHVDEPPASGDSAVQNTALENTEWVLSEIGGRPAVAPASAERPSLRLVADGNRVQSFGGCNQLVGGYELADTRLTFTQMASTRKFCQEEGVMEQEQALSVALTSTTAFRITGASLELLAGNNVLARLDVGE